MRTQSFVSISSYMTLLFSFTLLIVKSPAILVSMGSARFSL